VVVKVEPIKGTKWKVWSRLPRVLLSAEWFNKVGKLDIQYHDAATCLCEPADAVKAQQLVRAWTWQKEQKAVLRSAIFTYKQMMGKLPASIDTLVRNYPNNVLSGYTPFMKASFIELVKPMMTKVEKAAALRGAGSKDSGSASNKPSTQVNGTKASTSAASAQKTIADDEDPLTSPLEIIVDKAKHTLVLASGSMIIRSYPVGLGGGKTPEGKFFMKCVMDTRDFSYERNLR
jgi:hypothetical protein